MFEAIAVAYLLLVLGDFFSTFCYHIPEHVFGRLHVTTHHSAQKDFRHYAILTFNYGVVLDGILGALPYLLVAIFLWQLSIIGVIAGLSLGWLHVWWRHATFLGWQTSKPVALICQFLFITTPERHYLHHHKPGAGYGDIFTFYERPAQLWLRLLRLLRRHLKYSFANS